MGISERLRFDFWSRLSNALLTFGPTVGIYIVATMLTDAFFMADTLDYVNSIESYLRADYSNFWEFGHLFWRPLGLILFKLVHPLSADFAGPDQQANIYWTLLALNWVTGLCCVLAMRGLLGRLVSSRWVCNVVIVGFIFTQGFLNFTQSGSSYTSGLCFLALGLYILVGQSDTWWRPMAAGICFGVAVCLWFLFIWAIPAAALFPFMWSGITKRTLARVSVTCISVSLFVGFSYLAVLAMSGMHDPSVVRAWITSATHGVNFGGPTRAIFGFARSFINMGNDGILFKRFLLRDPLNPVPLAKLISVSLWKLALFYSFAAAIVAMGLRASRGWGLIALLAVGCGPMLLFAIEFDGGAVERYLPLYPYVFIVLGLGLASTRGPKLSKMVALIFILLMTLNNTIALSKVGLSRQQSAIETRIAGIQGKLTPGSFVYTAIWTDELINFNRSFPFNPLNINGALHVGSLVTQGTEEVKTWREDFAAKTLKVWQSGGDIWLSNRAVAERPKFDWNWVEGDDRNISWRDFPAFFSRLDLSESIGGEDGFRLVEPTDHNRVMLALLALKHP